GRAHETAGGGFRVDLAADRREDSAEKTGLPFPAGFALEGTVYTLRGEVYAVIYRDLQPPPTPALFDGAILDEVAGQLKGVHPGTKVVREGPVTVAGVCPGWELVLRVEDRTVVWRVVVAGPRVYQLFAQVTGSADGPRVRRFLDSFAVTDDALLAAARGRKKWEDGVKQACK